MSIRLGIIGAGSIGTVHAAAATKAGTTVTGVWDIDEEKARTLADTYPGALATTSMVELLARDDIDAVVVAVPNSSHKKIAIAALEAGKDLLLEKPMAMSVAECDEIIAAKEKTDRIVQLGFVSRYTPTAQPGDPGRSWKIR